MELALYCPVYGYYERDADIVGRAGDFQTNVSVGALFGELLAARVGAWIESADWLSSGPLHWVEAGAHDGRLAADVLTWLRRRRPALHARLQYHILEPSYARRQWQRQNLEGLASTVQWSPTWEALHRATGGVRGVIFCNELLDAQPVHRLSWDRAGQRWLECRVGWRDKRFVWERHPLDDAALRREVEERVPNELLAMLPEAYVVECSPAAERWWRDAAERLRFGWLMTFDYGVDDSTAVTAERMDGTLRGYRNHHRVEDLLGCPGEHDLTAHVHFDRIRRAGEAAGLRTRFFGEQGRFLTGCAAAMMDPDRVEPEWDPGRVRQFKTLIHPDHFGRSFRTLVQSREGDPGR